MSRLFARPIYLLAFLAVTLSSCIGDDFVDDFVDPVLRISASVDSLEVNTSFQFRETYLNNVGQSTPINGTWSSTDASVLSVSENGLATAHQEGDALLTVSYNDGIAPLEASVEVAVSALPVIITAPVFDTIMGSVATTTFYELEGDFLLAENDTGLKLTFANNYRASTALPGLYLYLSNNPNSIAGALEVGAVEVFNGAHTYDISDVAIDEYSHLLYFCKPFNVKVGDGEL